MFLFNKKTRNIIKYAWAFFAIIIILTMVIAYSGFVTLARMPSERIEIPEDVRTQLELQQQGLEGANTSEEQELLRAIEEGRLDIDSEQASGTPAAKPQELKLEI